MVSVLIVDDEDVLLEMIAALVEEAGYQTLMATNGREALAVLQSTPEPPALVISDIMMPHIGGVELAKLLKADPRYRQVPVILMSAAGRPPDSSIADFFLYKPFDLDRLMSVVDRYAHASSNL
jgi:CheY-like chemotaxis protein